MNMSYKKDFLVGLCILLTTPLMCYADEASHSWVKIIAGHKAYGAFKV
uniref:Uncharacterized protein n=1 Tax=Polynucleobacter necessarius subsp. necessarius (strain STIR1) TaxID=452638 RepID=B1XUN6_POLNS